MRVRPEVRVGLIVFVAFIALIAMYLFLGGFGLMAQTYPLYATFENVQTVEKGVDVRMAGVKIGFVRDIILTPQTKARVVMRIFDNYRIPRGSVAKISSAGVIGDYYVEIVPSQSEAYVKPGATLESVEITTINDLLAQAADLMEGLTGLTDDLKITTGGLNKILGDEQMAQSIKNTIVNLEQASESGLNIANRLNETVEGSTPQIQEILRRISISSQQLNVVTRDFAAVSQGARAELVEGGGFARIQTILQNAQAASANLASASEGLASLALDEEFIENIKVTAEQARRASTQAAEITERLGKIGKRKTEPREETYVPQSGLRIDAFAGTGDNSFRADVNYTLPPIFDDNFYRIGLFDIGESTKLNLQAGKALGKTSAFRYGLYASRLGIGYDKQVAGDLSFHADLFRPNDLSLEVKGLYRWDNNWGFWLGADNLLDDTNLLAGVQYRR